jgi:methylase of polypeptide subunit release factors
MSMTELLHWNEGADAHSALFRSENGSPLPKKLQQADDRISADSAFRLMCEGTALVWRGDFQNARQLLSALTRRVERKDKPITTGDLQQAFHLQRQATVRRVRILSLLLIPVEADYTLALRRAPDMQLALNQAWGRTTDQVSLVPLRELLGLVGAHEWRKKGIMVEALGQTIHPHYRVFAPTRNEYLDLVARVALPVATRRAFDIGTGTGVLAAILANRGVGNIIATDMEPRALSCARENLQTLGLNEQVQVVQTDLFPEGVADLIVCNPPWIPARPSSKLEAAIYDPDSSMLRGFLAGAADHLGKNGQAWLILSDLAEHLHLRSREQLHEWIAAGGLRVTARHDTRPRHAKTRDVNDPLHRARAAEICSLWVLQRA